MFWCGAFGLPLVVVVLSVGSGAGCSWLVRALLVWTRGLGALSRRLVDSCGLVVLTVLCGLLSPFRVLCCCPRPWARAHDWLRVGFLATWGRVLGVFVGAVQGWRVGVSCWLRAVGWLGVVWVWMRPGRARHGDVGRYGRPRGWMGAGYPLEERVSHAGAFSGSYWCVHIGVWRFWAVREAVARPEVWLLSRCPFLFSGLLSSGVRCGSWVS